MSKITWEDLERKDIAIHTPSKELMVKVANVIADKYGDITYEQNGDVCPNAYCVYEKDTCVELTNNEWSFADKEYYLENNYEIVEYEDVKHLFEDYIDVIETEEVKYLAKVKLINREEGYFMEEWEQGKHWIFPAEDINYADTFSNKSILKELLSLYKDEIISYEIIKQTVKTVTTYNLENN